MPYPVRMRMSVVAVAAVAIAATGCGKQRKVRFEPYSVAAAQAARSVGQPVVVYATADW
jgi:hypothetical protein